MANQNVHSLSQKHIKPKHPRTALSKRNQSYFTSQKPVRIRGRGVPLDFISKYSCFYGNEFVSGFELTFTVGKIRISN